MKAKVQAKKHLPQQREPPKTEIARLEAEGEALDEEISLPENSTDPDKLRDLTAKREAVDETLSVLYEQWERLSEQAGE